MRTVVSASEVDPPSYLVDFQSFHWEVILPEEHYSSVFVLQLNLLLILRSNRGSLTVLTSFGDVNELKLLNFKGLYWFVR